MPCKRFLYKKHILHFFKNQKCIILMNVIFIAYYIKINYNVGFASPEFDNILTNKPECVILRRKKTHCDVCSSDQKNSS